MLTHCHSPAFSKIFYIQLLLPRTNGKGGHFSGWAVPLPRAFQTTVTLMLAPGEEYERRGTLGIHRTASGLELISEKQELELKKKNYYWLQMLSFFFYFS